MPQSLVANDTFNKRSLSNYPWLFARNRQFQHLQWGP